MILIALLGILLGPLSSAEASLARMLGMERQRTSNMQALEADIARLSAAQDERAASRALRAGDIESLVRAVLPGREISAVVDGGQLRLKISQSPFASIVGVIEDVRKVEHLRLASARFRGTTDGLCSAELTFALAGE